MVNVKNLTQIKHFSTYKNVLSKNKISQSKGPLFFHFLMKKTFIFESKKKVYWLLNSSFSSPVFLVKNSSSPNTKERDLRTKKCNLYTTLFRKKRFALNEMVQQNASKFAIFYVKENPHRLFHFSLRFMQLYFFPLWIPCSITT